MEKKLIVNKEYDGKAVSCDYLFYAKEIGLWQSEDILFNKLFKKTDSILDLGCGAGRTTLALYKQGFENILGIDLSETAIKNAKKLAKQQNLDLTFMIANALSLPFEDNSFDGAIFSFNGLFCIPKKENRLKALQEIKRVLKPNAQLVFTAHNRELMKMFKAHFKEEEKLWANNQQDKKLYDFGDMLVDTQTKQQPIFLHLPTHEEVLNLLKEANLNLTSHILRDDITKTPAIEKLHFSLCRFYVVRK